MLKIQLEKANLHLKILTPSESCHNTRTEQTAHTEKEKTQERLGKNNKHFSRKKKT